MADRQGGHGGPVPARVEVSPEALSVPSMCLSVVAPLPGPGDPRAHV